MFVPAIAVLLLLAMALLFNAFAFGFASGEVMVNPNAKPGDNAELNRAANLAVNMFVAVQIALACMAVGSRAFKSRLHWAVRLLGAILGGVVLSYLGVVGILSAGGLPNPLKGIVGALGTWIQQQVRR